MIETDYGAIKDRAQLRSCRRLLKVQAEAKGQALSGLLGEVKSYYSPGKVASMVNGNAASSFSWAAVLLPIVHAVRKKLG